MSDPAIASNGDTGHAGGTSSLVAVAADILGQCRQMIEALPDDRTYTAVSRNVPGSTIGKHVRHLCDHFRLLFEGLDAGTAPSSTDTTQHTERSQPCILVDYDRRDAKIPAEKERAIAQQYVTSLLQRLEACRAVPEQRPVCVKAVIDAAGDGSVPLYSTWGRELWFCTHHAVHHHALIKAIGVEFNVSMPYSFGLAPSTQRREQANHRAA